MTVATTRTLASVFRAHLARPEALAGVAPAALEALLARLLDVAQARWGGLEQDIEVFTGYVAERLAGDDPEAALASLRGDELFLACACAHGVPEAINAFDAQYLRCVPKLLAQAGYTDEGLCEEVEQQLRERLLIGREGKLPKVSEYTGRGALLNWLRMAAVRTALNLLRSERKYAPGAHETQEEEALASIDPELLYIKAWYREDFQRAFRDAFASLSAEERNLLSFYLVDRLNIAEIGAIFGKHRATIARWIAQTRKQIHAAVRENLRKRLRLNDSELKSMIPLMHSQVELSLRGFLNEPSRGDAL
jgi:RNA polymerase sigma-70 factor (ECF subfamily)